MRKGRNPEFITARPKKNRKKVFVGVDLGADHVAEHEWGIKDIKRDFNIPQQPTAKCLGFEARKVCRVPESLTYKVEDDGTEVLSYPSYNRERVFPNKEKELQAAWSGRGFMIVSRSGKGELKELFEAFQNLNVVIFVGASRVFQNGGLKICIADRLPKESVKQAIELDQSSMRLQDASDKTGIIDRLKAAGCRYYACVPRWRRNDETASAYSVIFWLNPSEQRKNNYGWFTVEELDQWIAGEGPIPMKGKQ